MILVLSQSFESSTYKVIKWLDYLGGNYTKINGSELIRKDYTLELNNDKDIINSLFDINIVWYRRWIGFGEINEMIVEPSKLPNSFHTFEDFFKEELGAIQGYIFTKLANLNFVNKGCLNEPNKLAVLSLANECGLNIPNSIITSSKNSLKEFYKKNKRIITKPIKKHIGVKLQKGFYTTYTTEVDDATIQNLNDSFFPSFFQELLVARMEVRICYLNCEFYPMGILQRSGNKSIDIRNFDRDNPHRLIPIKIPLEIEEKLSVLMKLMSLEFASIDMIVTEDNKWVFLEVNPNGQFSMVSYPCNYQIEKKVAEFLINKDIENERV